jgi:hypothetical protein
MQRCPQTPLLPSSYTDVDSEPLMHMKQAASAKFRRCAVLSQSGSARQAGREVRGPAAEGSLEGTQEWRHSSNQPILFRKHPLLVV